MITPLLTEKQKQESSIRMNGNPTRLADAFSAQLAKQITRNEEMRFAMHKAINWIDLGYPEKAKEICLNSMLSRIGFMGSEDDRFWRKVAILESGCWEWTACKNNFGYGCFSLTRAPGAIKNVQVRAHRWAYEYCIGPIPEGLEPDHLCRNRACVNPWHLEPVTRQINLLRGETIPAANVSKTHCPKGHPYDESNTAIHIIGGRLRTRRCRICFREHIKKGDQRQKMLRRLRGLRKRPNGTPKHISLEELNNQLITYGK